MQSLHNKNWQLHDVRHSAAEMHDLDLAAERGIWNVEILGSALVLGSSQRDEVVNLDVCARDEVAVVHRRSGGGVVYLAGGEQLWVDVVIPRGDDLWTDDVVTSPLWLGDAWSRALTALGMPLLSVHRRPSVPSKWSRLICFAGVGPGEVLTKGVKVVGISQRRTRALARFQCIVHSKWSPERFLPLLAEPRPRLDEICDGVGVVDREPSQLLAAFVAELIKL